MGLLDAGAAPPVEHSGVDQLVERGAEVIQWRAVGTLYRGSCLRRGRQLWPQKLTGFHAAHSATTLLSGMPGMSMRRVCDVK